MDQDDEDQVHCFAPKRARGISSSPSSSLLSCQGKVIGIVDYVVDAGSQDKNKSDSNSNKSDAADASGDNNNNNLNANISPHQFTNSNGSNTTSLLVVVGAESERESYHLRQHFAPISSSRESEQIKSEEVVDTKLNMTVGGSREHRVDDEVETSRTTSPLQSVTIETATSFQDIDVLVYASNSLEQSLEEREQEPQCEKIRRDHIEEDPNLKLILEQTLRPNELLFVIAASTQDKFRIQKQLEAEGVKQQLELISEKSLESGCWSLLFTQSRGSSETRTQMKSLVNLIASRNIDRKLLNLELGKAQRFSATDLLGLRRQRLVLNRKGVSAINRSKFAMKTTGHRRRRTSQKTSIVCDSDQTNQIQSETTTLSTSPIAIAELDILTSVTPPPSQLGDEDSRSLDANTTIINTAELTDTGSDVEADELIRGEGDSMTNNNDGLNPSPRQRISSNSFHDEQQDFRPITVKFEKITESQLDSLSSLINIIRSGDYKEFSEMLDKRSEFKKNLLNVHVDGQTALHYAIIYRRSLAWCKQLVSNGANPNLANRAGWHPIHLAAFNGSRDTMRYLIDCIEHQ